MTDQQIKAYPTYFDGIEYRSRLEARWAAFFRHMGWETIYEPFDGHGYIPDFLIDGPSPLLVEVKPAVTRAQFNAPIPKICQGLRGIWDRDVLIVGASPLPGISNSWGDLRVQAGGATVVNHVRQARFGRQYPPIGLLGECFPWGTYCPGPGETVWEFAPGNWHTCRACGGVGVFHDYQSYSGRPCGHHDGDHFLGDVFLEDIRDAWATATNDVKWRGRDVT